MDPAAILRTTAHRPWPLPNGSWIMLQIWHDLLFAHWPIPPEIMRRQVPPDLPLDLFDGQAWLGIVPFHMSNVRLRGLPSLGGWSRFPELNVRTYVTLGGKPGVYFFSLDAASLPAVWGARAWYHLPYFHARMRADVSPNSVEYRSVRVGGKAELQASYRPVSEETLRERDTLDYWLTERYCLYSVHRGRVYRGEIHHPRWRLQDAAAEFSQNTMADAAGIRLPSSTPALHFSRRQEVLIWPLARVS